MFPPKIYFSFVAHFGGFFWTKRFAYNGMISELFASSKFIDSFEELGYDKDFEDQKFRMSNVTK